MSDTRARILSLSDAVALATVLDAAIQGARVRWVDDNHPDGVNAGTARHIVRDSRSAAFLGADDDVRDAYLRVTTLAGWEAWLPVADLIGMVRETTFVIDREAS